MPSTMYDDVQTQKSIINPSPKLIVGPQLLHVLAFQHCLVSDPAVDFKNADGSRTTLSYSALRHRSLHFAAKLRRLYDRLKVPRSEFGVVPVLLPQSSELYVAILAILEIGASFCPLNLDTPDDRLDFMIQDVGAKIVVTTTLDSQKFRTMPNVVTCIMDNDYHDGCDISVQAGSKKCPLEVYDGRKPSPNDWAYVMYTSGSTGQPKGVILSHLAVTQSLLAHDSVIPKFSRFLQFASPTFDVSMFEIFFTLFRGSTLVGCNRMELLNDLPGIINELDVDAAELTPTVTGSLLGKRRDVPKLQVLLTIGEMLTKNVVKEFGASPTQSPILYGMYGPTEAAIHCTAEPRFLSSSGNGLIGRPLATVSAFIAKPFDSESPSSEVDFLPIGHIGELIVGGHQLAEGYLNRQEQTKSVFLQHEVYGRLYRTGDKARMLPDGSLECLGRIQTGQVKLRGQRIELGEIEQAAMQTKGCILAVTSIIRDNLVLFCLVDGETIQQGHVIETCKRWLLPYMMPNDVVFRRKFPQLASGKVDKKSLEASYDTTNEDEMLDSDSTEDTELATKICQAAQDVLCIPVHATLDLSRVGLDSLRSIQLVSQLRKYGIEANAVDILKAGSVKSICSALQKEQVRFDSSIYNDTFRKIRQMALEQPELKGRQQDIAEILPCTPLQASMLVETLKEAQAYCNWVELEFEDGWAVDVVSRAFTRLIDSRPILRSGFVAVEGHSVGFAQVVWKECGQDQVCCASAAFKRNFALHTPDDFLRPPQVSIVEISPFKTRAIIQLHHAMYDGWSMDLLIEDLNAALKGNEISERPSFNKVTEYLMAVSESSIADDSRDYWERQLADFKPLLFPDMHGDEMMNEDTLLSITSHEVDIRPKDLASYDRFHPQVYFQCALAYLWAAYVGSLDVIIGSVSSGRTLPVPDVDIIIGPCISTFPLRVNLDRSKRISDLLSEIHESNRQMLEHCSVALKEIKKLANVNPGMQLFDVVFIWQESLINDDSSSKNVRQINSADYLESKLLIEVVPHENSITLKASQQGHHLPEAQVKILLQQFEMVVKCLVGQNPAALSDIVISDIDGLIPEKLLSARTVPKVHVDLEILNRETYNILPTEVFTCIVSEDLAANADWNVLPIGSIGTLCLRENHDWLLDEVESTVPRMNYHPKYGVLYRTPYIARMHQDDQLQIIGLRQDFAWLNKQQINLDMPSAFIRQLPNVENCFTFVHRRGAQEVLVSFWTPGPEIKIEMDYQSQDLIKEIGLPAVDALIVASQDIYDRLRSSSLPACMIPARLVPVVEIPHDVIKRLDLATTYALLPVEGYLEHFEPLRRSTEEDLSQDRLEIEHNIANALAFTLKIPNSSYTRSTAFFRLGLDSISAISLARVVNQRLNGPKADVPSILQHPTIGRLAAHLSSQPNIASHSGIKDAEHLLNSAILETLMTAYESQGIQVETVRRCTPLQEGMLSATSNEVYCNHTLFHLLQDPRRFAHAFDTMCRRHDILRTCFASTEDLQSPFVQVVLKDYTIPWAIVSTASDRLDLTVEELVNRELIALDTMKPPLSITQICSDKDSYILFSLHHALYDGEAMSQLLGEIEMVLNEQELPIASSFDAFLTKSIVKDFRKADGFWEDHLTGFVPRPLIRITHVHGADTSESLIARTQVVSETLRIRLSEVEKSAQTQSVTIQTLFQTAWAKLLSIIFDTADVCFGSVVSGRTLPMDGVEKLVAPCFNTLPVRIQFHSTLSNGTAMRRLNDSNAEALMHQFTPLRRIQARLNLNGMRLFDTVFILQRPQIKLDQSLWSIRKDFGVMGFPIVCEVIPNLQSDKIQLTMHLEKSFVPDSRVQALFDTFMSSLGSCINKPSASFNEFDYTQLKQSMAKSEQLGHLHDNANHDVVSEIRHFESNTIGLAVRQAISRFSGLPLQQILPTKTIYQLGLDSISAIQIAKVLRNKGFEVSSEHILEGKTLPGIVDIIEQNVDSVKVCFDFTYFDRENRSNICSIHHIDESWVSSVRPCTQSQAGMISQSLTSNGKTYINHMVYELNSDVDLDRLHLAWMSVLDGHEMLRTGFSTCDDAVHSFAMIQYHKGKFEVPWNILLNEESAQTPISTLYQIRGNVAEQIFSALHLPPWRLSIVRSLGNEEKTFQFSAHHALYDAESIRMIFSDVMNAYDSKPLLFQASIDPLLNAIISSEDSENDIHKDYWQSLLCGMSINKFPDLNPLRTPERHVQSLSIISKNGPELEQECRNLGITLQAALQVAWARLISEYLGEPDVTLGIVLSGRDSNGADEIPFPSTTTIPYRCRVGNDINVMLQDAMKYNTSIRRHQHSPLTQIKRWAGFSSSSIFDTLLVVQVNNEEDLEHRLWRLVDEEATVEYPISLEVMKDRERTMEFRVVFWDDILPVAQARLLLSQLSSILNDTILGQRDDHNRLLTDDLVSRLPPKISEIVSDVKTLHGFVEATAKKLPDKVALEFSPNLEDESWTRRWSYQELEDQGNRLANLLIDLGATPRALVAVCFDKCPEASFAMLGILKVGCGFLPLDPTVPSARKAFILEDSQSCIVLTMETLAKDMTFHENVQVVCVDSLDWGSLNTTKPRSSDQVEPSDVGYCLYTSGSTGTPKGCLISHENVVQAMLAFQEIFRGRWNESSRWLQFASFHFDVSILEQFWSWSVGICVVSTPRDQLFADLPGVLKKLGITHIDLTPSLARLITPEQIPSLCKGIFITGGEPLKQEVLDSWGSTGVIHNGYGPTESTIGCTMYPRVPQNGKPANIGWQFDNVGTYVFAPGTTDLVLRGAIGELCVSGKLVGLGYLNRPELTAESFPFVEKLGEKIYRTNDLVRMLHDGSFEFLGRNDDQVKLRGQRLELGEINRVINANVQAVREVVTIIVKRTDNQSEQLVSFLALGRSTTEALSEISSKVINEAKVACQTRLPGYMVPSHIFSLESIPLTGNNKSDIKKLKDIFTQSIQVKSDDQRIADLEISTLHKAIVQILADFLSIPCGTISPLSNVFELGLDSISAFGFSRVLQNKGYSGAHPTIILQNRTISHLVKAIGDFQPSDPDIAQAEHEIAACQKRHGASIARRLGLSFEELESVFPCTPLQQGMLVRSLEKDERPYFNTFLYELHVQVGAFRSALDEIVASVPILRTVFVPVEKGYVQAVLQKRSLHESWYKDKETSGETLGEAIHRLRDEWFNENEEIFRTPFQAISLHDKGRSYMVINVFHALYDAIGLSLLQQKLGERLCDRDHVDYGPFFHDALAFGPLNQVKGAKSFWGNKLKDAIFNQLPIKNPDLIHNISTATFELENIERFEPVRRQLGLTHQALVQAAWTSVLYDFIGMPTTMGMVVSGRSIAFQDAENIIGPMFNTIPIFVNISRGETWKSLAQKCHEFNMAAIPFQHTPLRDIQKWCSMSGRRSLFDALFVFQKQVAKSPVDTSQLWRNLSSTVNPDYPLAFEAEHTATGTLSITIVAQARIADEITCHNLLRRFRTNFNLLLSDPNKLLSEAVDVSNFVTQNMAGVSTVQHVDEPKAHSEAFDWSPQALALRQKVAELSGIEETNVHEHSSIFELGLDSIDAIKLSSTLKQKGFSLSMSSIIRNPTILQMSRVVLATPLSPSTDQSAVEPLKRFVKNYISQLGLDGAQFDNVLPATPLQEALVADMYSSRFENYFNHDILQLMPEVNIETLREAIATVYNNTPILRTSFLQIDSVDIGSSFAQLVLKGAQPNWETFELSDSLTMDDVLDCARDQMATALTHAPMCYLVPLKFSYVFVGDTNYLVLSMAHALYDGWSVALFHDDIFNAYFESFSSRPGTENVLDKVLGGDTVEASVFWHDYVGDVSGCLFPVRNLELTETKKVHRKEQLSVLPLSKIQAFCREQGVGLHALGQLCWAFVLGTYAHNLDVIFGVVLSGREDEEAQHVMLPTMNTVTLRSVISGSRSEMVRAMQFDMANLMQYQHFSLRKVHTRTGLPSSSLFNTLFIYQKRPTAREANNRLYESIGGSSSVGYPVCVEMEVVGNTFLWRTACDEVGLSQDGTQNLLNDLDLVLGRVIQNPDAGSIDFKDNKVSICGLPAFKVLERDTKKSTAVVPNTQSENTPQPLSWIEHEVRAALSAVSKVPESSILATDTIFHLGLDSISLIKVSSILRKCSLKISVSEIMKAGTIQNIATSIESAQSNVGNGLSLDVNPQAAIERLLKDINTRQLIAAQNHDLENIETILPATPGQVYFLSQWQNTKGTLFSSSFDYQIKDDIDLDQIRSAWIALVKCNAILRTSFACTGNKRIPIVQLVHQSPQESFVDLSSQENGFIPHWDLSEPPVLLCARKLSSGAVQLSLHIHHALYDAISLPLLIQQLQELCNGSVYAHSRSDSIAFKQFLALSTSPGAQIHSRTFWTAYLNSARNLHPFEVMPSSKPLTDVTKRTKYYRPQSLWISNEFNTAVRASGLSIQSVFLAAFAAAYSGFLHTTHGEAADEKARGENPRDVIFGVYLANRSHDIRTKNGDGEQSLATLPTPTVNLLPIVVRYPSATQLFQCAKQIQTDLQKISSFDNANVGLWEIEAWTGVKVDCFVNFLRLPGDDHVPEDGRVAQHKIHSVTLGDKLSTQPEVTITSLSSKDSKSVDHINNAKSASPMAVPHGNFSVSLALERNAVNGCYPPSWDIEAAVRDGALDIGVFGPSDVIDSHAAELIMNELVQKLETGFSADTTIA